MESGRGGLGLRRECRRGPELRGANGFWAWGRQVHCPTSRGGKGRGNFLTGQIWWLGLCSSPPPLLSSNCPAGTHLKSHWHLKKQIKTNLLKKN